MVAENRQKNTLSSLGGNNCCLLPIWLSGNDTVFDKKNKNTLMCRLSLELYIGLDFDVNYKRTTKWAYCFFFQNNCVGYLCQA